MLGNVITSPVKQNKHVLNRYYKYYLKMPLNWIADLVLYTPIHKLALVTQ